MVNDILEGTGRERHDSYCLSCPDYCIVIIIIIVLSELLPSLPFPRLMKSKCWLLSLLTTTTYYYFNHLIVNFTTLHVVWYSVVQCFIVLWDVLHRIACN